MEPIKILEASLVAKQSQLSEYNEDKNIAITHYKETLQEISLLEEAIEKLK